jgi:hypothetical protein
MAVAAPSEFAKQHWLAMSTHWMKMAAVEEAALSQMATAASIGSKAHYRRVSLHISIGGQGGISGFLHLVAVA